MRGRNMGALRQIGSAGGFFIGLFIGIWLQQYLIRLVASPLSRSLLTILVTLGLAFAFSAYGEYVALHYKNKLTHHRLDRADKSFGVLISIATLFITIWLIASVAVKLPFPTLQDGIRQSKFISALDRTLPPAPPLIAKLSRLIAPNGFPDVFTGGEPSPSQVSLPDSSVMKPAVDKDQASVVKIEGLECGGIAEGSGFIVDNDLVVTNAHVVAGVRRPVVEDQSGSHRAVAVWFDPNLDIAFLQVSGLKARPLSFVSSKQPTGTPAAALGYPGGGNFDAQLATIADEFSAVGRNIYGGGLTNRDVYSIKSIVRPGNSGGPLIDKEGDVLGVVFATSTEYSDIGYVITADQVAKELGLAQGRQPVSTGACAG